MSDEFTKKRDIVCFSGHELFHWPACDVFKRAMHLMHKGGAGISNLPLNMQAEIMGMKTESERNKPFSQWTFEPLRKRADDELRITR